MGDTTEKTASGCSVQLLDLVNQPYCHEPVTVTYVSGCVGEHLDEDRFCERHAGLVHDGDVLCVECWRSGARVPVAVLAEVLPSGERVRVARIINGTTPQEVSVHG